MNTVKKDNFVRSNILQQTKLTANYSKEVHNSAFSEQEESDFTFKNSLDGLRQQGDDKMIHHSTTAISSANPIWVPADKHPKISPSEFEHWIKTHSNEGTANTNTTTVQRKRSVLSSVSYNSSDEESSDDDTMPPTPTIEPLPPLLISEHKHRHNHNITVISGQPENKLLLHRQAKHAQGLEQQGRNSAVISSTIEESRARSPENNMQHVETQQVTTQQHPSPRLSRRQKDSPVPIDNPVIVNKPIIDSSEHNKHNKKSWFTGLLHDLKKSASSKTNNSNTSNTKKAGLAGFFSSNKSSNASSTSLIQKLSSSSSTKTTSTKANSTKSNTSQTKTLRKKKRLPASLVRKLPQVPSTPLISRYPLDTERAIYRLSHVKLSNSKRPLQQQVVISNMMYWYLSVTERQQQRQLQMQQQQQQQQHQLQQHQYNNNFYYTNTRQQVYFDNVYQATYHSFEPPAPGGSNYYTNNTNRQYNNHTYQQKPDADPYVLPPNNVTKEDNNIKLNTKKDKYRPVRNTHYEPIVASR